MTDDRAGIPDRDPEHLLQQMLDWLTSGESSMEFEANLAADPVVDNPRGLLSAYDDWSRANPAAASGLARAYVAAMGDRLMAAPLSRMTAALIETALAFASADMAGVDEFLRLRPPTIADSADGKLRVSIFTAITDRVALTREIVGPQRRSAHHRSAPPSLDVHLLEAHRAESLREGYGLNLRQALELDAQPKADVARRIFSPLLESVRQADVSTGAGLAWLLEHAPAALADMPFTQAVVDALQGNTAPRADMRLTFVHVMDLPKVGYVAYVAWHGDAKLSKQERRQLAGHLRLISDTKVAPWNRWADRRSRREAFFVWVRRLLDERLEAEALADQLRREHPEAYLGEDSKVTIRRIYRISTKMSDISVPKGLIDADEVPDS